MTTRKPEPWFDLNKRVTYWRCPLCSWIKRVEPEFIGLLVPSSTTLKVFGDHYCDGHLKIQRKQSEAT